MGVRQFGPATLPLGRHAGVKPAPPAADTGSLTWDVGYFPVRSSRYVGADAAVGRGLGRWRGGETGFIL